MTAVTNRARSLAEAKLHVADSRCSISNTILPDRAISRKHPEFSMTSKPSESSDRQLLAILHAHREDYVKERERQALSPRRVTPLIRLLAAEGTHNGRG